MTKLRIFCFLGRARNRFQKLWASTLSRCRSNVLRVYVCFSCRRIPATLKAKLVTVSHFVTRDGRVDIPGESEGSTPEFVASKVVEGV